MARMAVVHDIFFGRLFEDGVPGQGQVTALEVPVTLPERRRLGQYIGQRPFGNAELGRALDDVLAADAPVTELVRHAFGQVLAAAEGAPGYRYNGIEGNQ